jgi:hypothetical protein
MRYLPDHKITFIHNPKTAGTSIATWLDENFRTVEGRKHGSWREVQEFFPDTVFTFGVVRNPWDRMASWYKFVGHGGFEDWIGNRLLYGHNDVPSVGMTFKPHVSWAKQWYNLGTPQADWLGDSVNLTLRYENLEEDFKEIQRILGCYKPLPMLNTSGLTDFKELYTIETVELVRHHYMKDIVRYDYKYV